ncbi:kinesin-like protein [Trifolium medium]|uniref:Kinesin-like protein n=1 Tax=Trifolium medium TaxID=97028 RepID=A0A392M7Q0_9FABA|nr:kinesin-like protein [Trifolium medium]
MTGCGGLETTHHLFLSCPVFGPLWRLVRAWIGISTAGLNTLQDHLVQFTHSAGGSRPRRSFMQLIWLCCIWVVWTERNNRVFKDKEATLHQMLDKVKLHSLWWLKTVNVNLGLHSHLWWSSPFVCLGIDRVDGFWYFGFM